MKKIFTLLFSTAILSTAFAQYGQRERHDDVIVYNNKGYDKYDKNFDRDGRDYNRHGKGYGRGAYIFSPRNRDMEIEHIQHDYEHKFREIRSSFGMGWNQKKRIMNNLEAQRNEEIAMVWRKFKSPKNKFGDNGRRNGQRW